MAELMAWEKTLLNHARAQKEAIQQGVVERGGEYLGPARRCHGKLCCAKIKKGQQYWRIKYKDKKTPTGAATVFCSRKCATEYRRDMIKLS